MADIATPNPMNTPVNNGYALAALGAILFSLKGILIKLAYGGVDGAPAVDAITLLTLRMAFALPIYGAIGLLAWRARARDGLPMPSLRVMAACITLGLLGYYGSAYLDFEGLVYLSAQMERLILFTYPMFVMLLGAMFFGYAVSVRGVFALILAYAGIAVIFGGGAVATGEHVLLGAAFVFTGAFTFAVYQLVAGPLIKEAGTGIFTAAAMIAAALGTFTHFLATHSPGTLLTLPPRILWLAVAMAVFATVLPSLMLNGALGKISAQAVSVIGTVSPVATIAMAVTFIGEPFTPVDALGTAMVIGGVALFTLLDARRGKG